MPWKMSWGVAAALRASRDGALPSGSGRAGACPSWGPAAPGETQAVKGGEEKAREIPPNPRAVRAEALGRAPAWLLRQPAAARGSVPAPRGEQRSSDVLGRQQLLEAILCTGLGGTGQIWGRTGGHPDTELPRAPGAAFVRVLAALLLASGCKDLLRQPLGCSEMLGLIRRRLTWPADAGGGAG